MVRFGDLGARALITVGGIGTIIAVCLVFVFLGMVVVPLFRPPQVTQSAVYDARWLAEAPLHVELDEYQTMGWALLPDGKLRVFQLKDGQTIEERTLFAEGQMTAVAFDVRGGGFAIGFADGTLRVGRIGFDVSFRERRDVPEPVQALSQGETAVFESGVVQRTPQGQFRLQTIAVELNDRIQVTDGPIRQLDLIAPDMSQESTLGASELMCCAYSDMGQLKLCRIRERANPFLGTKSLESKTFDLPLDVQSDAAVISVLLIGSGDNVYVVCEDGTLTRYDTRSPADAKVVERTNVLPDGDRRLVFAKLILGRETVVCGDSKGGLRAWFRVRQTLADGDDNTFALSLVHDLQSADSPPTSFAASRRGRSITVGYEDGSLRLYHVTTERLLLEQQLPDPRAIRYITIAPRDDGLLVASGTGIWRCELAPGHPEAAWSSLFLPVWYEGYQQPEHIWQSSFAGVEPEMKLGMVPLVFGTIKATFYSMLFGAPVALLAAIYTSEFLDSRIRARIKPGIEMMASLPSVVLGFLAAQVFASQVESIVPAILIGFLTIPLTYLAAAQLWFLLPHHRRLSLARHRFFFMCLILPVGFLAAWSFGPVVEGWFFAGDVKAWLDGRIGNGIGGWMLLLLPLAGVLAVLVTTLYVNTHLRARADRFSRRGFAAVNLLKFVLAVVAMFLTAYGLSWLLDAMGWDPRGSYIATYDPRNSLVVGFVMGFAIIPIIYTIADDALRTVPNHLRSGSLGCGATPWQTTWRIVIPTAMSGLFSALMIGLGRAVGETMIVLMATGNTPIMEWNVFNGFRTLAANIAVELPEAVQNSTHYRTLFLCALTLFMMTFVINTVAEAVRMRFRKRAYQL
jgi:phosphate transport system permease protein